MIFLAAILFLYCIVAVTLIFGFYKAVQQTHPAFTPKEKFISVVIAVRNEAHHIERLLQNLLTQQYENFQVIIVDDASTDDTFISLDTLSNPRLSVFRNPGQGKKSALTYGISKARGSIIATTDADCILSPRWLKSINEYFQNETLNFLFGGVKFISKRSFFSVIQSLEFASLIGSSAATSAMKIPVMCNGANLAYRKDVFDAVKGYEGNMHVPSGDDEFLMRKINHKYPGSVRFAAATEMIVKTEPLPDINSFFQQRIRWASKWRHNSSWQAIALAFLILLTQFTTIMVIGITITEPDPLILFALGVKVFTEFIFLSRVCFFLGIPWNWLAFMVLQFIYPFYVVTVGVSSNFLSYHWRGRKIA